MDWATTATASLIWADSFFPLMSWRPMRPETVPANSETRAITDLTITADQDPFAMHISKNL